MLLFVAPPYRRAPAGLLAAADVSVGRFGRQRFANGELHVTIEEEVRDQACVVLGSIAPPDEQMLSMLLLCHTLKKEGAREVVALLPYLAYSRQDKACARESLAAAWTGALLRGSQVDRVVTFDVHSPRAARQSGIPVVSLSPAAAFAKQLGLLGPGGAISLVAPDDGAIARCKAVSEAAQKTQPIVCFHKQRTGKTVRHEHFEGVLAGRAVVVDDILDTGATLVSCCRELTRAGVTEIVVMITHGLFTGEAWKELWAAGVRQIYTTDTVPLPPQVRSSRIHVLPIVADAAPALRAAAAAEPVIFWQESEQVAQ